ncbi:MAG: inositol monophosphatase [Holosporales bacterium]|jgi:myo-inositol-1(or 4)-monophosphatase|nr:inositol monophosphatase [Holosporales bacterium]
MLGVSGRSSAVMNVMILAAQKAARGLIRDFGELEKLQTSKKSFGNFVTTADKRAEALLIEELSNARQEYSILTEERGEIPALKPLSRFDQNGGYRWIIDPLDGTTNFWHGIPYFAVSVALERFGETIAGVVFNPITNELFWAEKGRGAFLNNQRIRVSGRRSLESLLVVTGSTFGFRGDDTGHLKLNTLVGKVGAIRHFGAISLDLAFVAAGRVDAFFEKSVPLWDKAAGCMIVLEAGGVIINYENDGIIAGNESGSKVLQNSVC